MGDPGAELVEEVDPEGRVVRIVTRAEMRARRLRHRTTFVAVVDDRGRLLVHRRSAAKDVWPSRWDLAAGGVAAVGEDWETAARRELAEELGIEAPVEDLGRDGYEDDDVRSVSAIFLARHGGSFQFCDGEVVDARWVSIAELDELIDHEEFCPDSMALVLPRIRPYLAREISAVPSPHRPS